MGSSLPGVACGGAPAARRQAAGAGPRHLRPRHRASDPQRRREAGLRDHAGKHRAGDRVAHVQVCANDRGAPGSGHLDWRAILAALDDVGYDGPLVIESFTADNATIATAASIWRPLAVSQDALATDGLAFLRSLT